MARSTLKISIIGAGSVCFFPATLSDILLDDRLCALDMTIALMDIDEEALQVSTDFARRAIAETGRQVQLISTMCLEKALEGADFVVTAIEVNRYYYWSMDFHIPRRYGFRQIYGENGGPGGMFHALRNIPPMIEIARTMEKVCPDAYLLNYANPEAKLIEAVSKLTSIKAVGLCHGENSGRAQVAKILDIPMEELDTEIIGLNHFGWFTKIARKGTGEDLYPLLRQREREMDWLANYDDLSLIRLMLRTYGLYSYPGTNHVGEYIAWSDDLLGSSKINFAYDPVVEDPWNGGRVPEFVANFESHPTDRPYFAEKPTVSNVNAEYRQHFQLHKSVSREFGISIIRAITFDEPTEIGAVNVLNKGYAPNLPENMAIEIPAMVDGKGIHPHTAPMLPTAIASMIQTQGAIHQLLIEAYQEKSRSKLLQALLLDPTSSTYHNAVALINEMCERQKELLPEMHW